MVNLDKLAGKMRECRLSQTEMAKEIGISATSFSNKMTGKVQFSILEAKRISERLAMTADEVHEIFF